MNLVKMQIMYRKPRKALATDLTVKRGDNIKVWNWQLKNWDIVRALSKARGEPLLRIRTTKGRAVYIPAVEGEAAYWWLESPPNAS